MDKGIFSFNSLCEVYNSPFMIVNNHFQIVQANKAWESLFGRLVHDLPCCSDVEECRHRQLMQNFEPYAGFFTYSIDGNELRLSARGFPLLDKDGRMFIAEIIENITNPAKTHCRYNMVGNSVPFVALSNKLEQAASSDVAVLLKGETGTGKELAAQFIHAHGEQCDNNFIVVDCTVLGDNLFESELFGHEKGAFTGANTAKKGLLELANNGTLFLDEIGELPLHLQPKLLRAIENGQFRRVGGNLMIRSKFKIISASHRNLATMIKNGSFREDLFYRLSVFQIDIPPLRKRKKDIPLLVQHLLENFAAKSGASIRISNDAMQKLLEHSWPGNIRELKNCVQLALSLAMNNIIQEHDIHIKESIVSATQTSSGKVKRAIVKSGVWKIKRLPAEELYFL